MLTPSQLDLQTIESVEHRKNLSVSTDLLRTSLSDYVERDSDVSSSCLRVRARPMCGVYQRLGDRML